MLRIMRIRPIHLEAYALLHIFRLAIFILPFKWIAPVLGKENRETETMIDEWNLPEIRKVRTVIKSVDRFTFWKRKCLAQAFAAKILLNRRKIESTVYLGIAYDDNRKLVAHAWLRAGNIYVTGGDGEKKYAVTGHFA